MQAARAMRATLSLAFERPQPEPARGVAHWDLVLQEARWLAEDFGQARPASVPAAGLRWGVRQDMATLLSVDARVMKRLVHPARLPPLCRAICAAHTALHASPARVANAAASFRTQNGSLSQQWID